MSKGKACVEPKIGNKINEYNEDALRSSEEKRLVIEEQIMFEAHFMRCPFCRGKLNLNAQLIMETKLIMSGLFLDDPVLRENRRQTVLRLFRNKLSFKEFQGDWLKVSKEERQKLKAFMKKNS